MRFKILISGLLLSSSVVASQLSQSGAYIGVESHMRFINSNPVNNEFVYKKKLPQAHIVGGYKLNENFGVEAGATLSNKTKNTYVQRFQDSSTCGYVSESTHHSKLRISSMHIGALGYLPILPNLSAIGGLGGSRVKAETIINGVEQRKSKVVPRAIVGGQYAVTDSIALRATTIFESCNNLDGNLTKFKNSLSIGLGAQYSF